MTKQKYKTYGDEFRQLISAEKRNAIIVDMDGTLAHMNGRSPYDDKRSNADIGDFAVMFTIKAIALAFPSVHILIVSGRNERSRKATEEFLNDYDVSYDDLFMRGFTDFRKDSDVKRDIFNDCIKDNYNVLAVFDDRTQVVKVWRELGLKVFQVADGDF